MSLQFYRPWVAQPNGAPPISTIFARKLLFCAKGSGGQSGIDTRFVGSGTPLNGVSVYGGELSSNSSFYLSSSAASFQLTNAPECSWVVAGRIANSTTNYIIGGFGNLAVNTERVQFDSYAGQLRAIVVNAAGQATSVTGPSYANGAPFVAVFTVSAGRVPSIYALGVKYVGSAGTGTTGTFTGLRRRANAKLDPDSIYAEGFSLEAAWARCLSDDEAFSLIRNPWSVYAPRRIIISAASAAIVPPTLLAASAVNIGATFATPRVTFTRP